MTITFSKILWHHPRQANGGKEGGEQMQNQLDATVTVATSSPILALTIHVVY